MEVKIKSEASSNRCFLCRKRFKSDIVYCSIADAVLKTSKKPLKSVFIHLAKCLKKPLSISENSWTCLACFDKLEMYDNIMIKLMKTQKELVQMLDKSLNGTVSDDDDFKSESSHDEMNTSMSNAGPSQSFIGIENDIKMEDDFDDDDDNQADDDFSSDDEEYDSSPNSKKIDSKGSEIKIMECEEPGCKKKFYSAKSFEIHQKQHKSEEFVCKICGVKKVNEEYLELHMNLHEGKTEFECRYCPNKYARRTNVIRHMQLHWDKKAFQCEKCGERFSQRNILYNHTLLHEGQENPLICEVCNQVFKTRKTLRNHLNTHRPDRKKFDCQICEKSFTERYTLKVHLKTHAEGYVGPASGRIPRRSRDLKETETSMEFDYQKCVICDEVFNGKQKLDVHMHSQHDVVLKDENPQMVYNMFD